MNSRVVAQKCLVTSLQFFYKLRSMSWTELKSGICEVGKRKQELKLAQFQVVQVGKPPKTANGLQIGEGEGKPNMCFGADGLSSPADSSHEK